MNCCKAFKQIGSPQSHIKNGDYRCRRLLLCLSLWDSAVFRSEISIKLAGRRPAAASHALAAFSASTPSAVARWLFPIPGEAEKVDHRVTVDNGAGWDSVVVEGGLEREVEAPECLDGGDLQHTGFVALELARFGPGLSKALGIFQPTSVLRCGRGRRNDL